MYLFHISINILSYLCLFVQKIIRRFVLNEYEGNGIDSQKQNDVCNEP